MSQRAAADYLSFARALGCRLEFNSSRTEHSRDREQWIEGRPNSLMGARRGWPDLEIMTPNGILFVELKGDRGRIEPEQAECHERLRSLGAQVHVIKDGQPLAVVLEIKHILEANGVRGLPTPTA